MLQQYSDQPFADLGNNYSTQLNSCSSYLLNSSSFSEVSRANDSSTSSNDDNDFLGKDVGCIDEYSVSSFDVESIVIMGKDVELQPSDCCEAFEDVTIKETQDDTANQQLITDEQNNNVCDLVTEQCPTVESCQEPIENPPQVETNAPVEPEVQLPAPKNNDEEFKDLVNTVTSENIVVDEFCCDETESNSRLPGFHQAFGSTEIGRFVHQKDFIEQINQQTSFMPTKSLLLSSIPPCSSSPIINNSIMNAGGSPKIRARYNKRLKVPAHALPPPLPSVPSAPADIARNMSSSWSNYEYDVDPTINFQSANSVGGNYYASKYRDTRLKRNQYFDGNGAPMPPPYCNGDDYYPNCSSSYYYGGGGGGGGSGCSESMNCDYYTHRYQPNSSYYHNGYSAYSNHTGYSNGYHYSKDHSDRYTPMIGGDATPCGINQNCQVDKYHYSSYNEEQIPYHYSDKLQSSNLSTYHQYQPYMSHNQHQLPSQQPYNNYNAYNSYPISSFNYY